MARVPACTRLCAGQLAHPPRHETMHAGAHMRALMCFPCPAANVLFLSLASRRLWKRLPKKPSHRT